MSQRLKQTKFKLIDGGAREPSPPQPPDRPKRTSRLEYAAFFAVSGVIWITIGYWIWNWIFR